MYKKSLVHQFYKLINFNNQRFIYFLVSCVLWNSKLGEEFFIVCVNIGGRLMKNYSHLCFGF